jgi:hypothetical protein
LKPAPITDVQNSWILLGPLTTSWVCGSTVASWVYKAATAAASPRLNAAFQVSLLALTMSRMSLGIPCLPPV